MESERRTGIIKEQRGVGYRQIKETKAAESSQVGVDERPLRSMNAVENCETPVKEVVPGI